MRKNWLCVLLLLAGASAARAQQWPAYNYGPYYQGYQQAPAQRYYYPYSYGGYASSSPYYAPRYNNSPYNTASSPGNGYYYTPQSTAAAPVTSTVMEPSYANQPIVAPHVSVPLPPSPPPGPEREENLLSLWQRMVKAVTPPGPPPGEERPPLPYHRPCKEAFWISADYVAAYITPMRLAGPLVTTGSVNNTNPGALGQPSTAVLFGNQNINFNTFSGAKLEAGLFLDMENQFSLDWGGLLLSPNTKRFAISSDPTGNPLLTRPVFATDLGGERVFLTAFPNQFAGNLNIDIKSLMAGTEFNFRYHMYSHERLHSDLLFGFRYLRLAESLKIQETINGINGNTIQFPPGTGAVFDAYKDQDSFATTNQFFGAQIGGRARWEGDWWDINLFGKLGLGATVEHVDINGSTTFLSPTGNLLAAGGVLALPSNIGTYSRTVFGIVPEMGINLGLNVTNNVRLNLGYSGILWNKVVRPGMQFDRNVNTALAPTGNFGGPNVTGPIAPLFRFNDEFFWMQALNVGIEFHY